MNSSCCLDSISLIIVFQFYSSQQQTQRAISQNKMYKACVRRKAEFLNSFNSPRFLPGLLSNPRAVQYRLPNSLAYYETVCENTVR
jgi:hypothetical protein